MEKTCFLSFSKQNHAESSRNLFKNLALNPKHGKFYQNSDFGNVLCVLRPDSGGRPQSQFGRIRTAVPNLSSAGFGRPSQSEFGWILASHRSNEQQLSQSNSSENILAWWNISLHLGAKSILAEYGALSQGDKLGKLGRDCAPPGPHGLRNRKYLLQGRLPPGVSEWPDSSTDGGLSGGLLSG